MPGEFFTGQPGKWVDLRVFGPVRTIIPDTIAGKTGVSPGKKGRAALFPACHGL